MLKFSHHHGSRVHHVFLNHLCFLYSFGRRELSFAHWKNIVRRRGRLVTFARKPLQNLGSRLELKRPEAIFHTTPLHTTPLHFPTHALTHSLTQSLTHSLFLSLALRLAAAPDGGAVFEKMHALLHCFSKLQRPLSKGLAWFLKVLQLQRQSVPWPFPVSPWG